MTADITYRFLTPDDAAVFREHKLRSFKEEPASFFFTVGEKINQPITHWEAMLKRDYNIGAFVDGQLVGTSGLWPEIGVKIRHRGYLGAVYMIPEMRGKGIARAMITRLLDKAKEAGLELVRLSTDVSNPASVGLYKSLGFQPYGMEQKFLKLEDGTYVDEVMMILFLK